MPVNASIASLSALAVFIGSLFAGFFVLDSRHVSASEFEEFSVTVYYGQYYDNVDRIEVAEARGQTGLAREIRRLNEQIKTKICERAPGWERCGKTAKL